MKNNNLNYSFEKQNKHKELIEKSLLSQKSNAFHSYSALWSSLFEERKEDCSFNRLQTLLSDNNFISTGITSSRGYGKNTKLFFDYFKDVNSNRNYKAFPLSRIGTPTIVEFENDIYNISHSVNTSLFLTIESILKEKKIKLENLNILEIGAGYGGFASIILSTGYVRSYTIIDLPENLLISNYYLTENFSELKCNILNCEEPLLHLEEDSLNFTTPGNIESLEHLKFDLVINTDSLGEMPKETAQAYIKWISEHLSEDGVFFSKNGHRRSEDSTPLPSEYGYDQFEMIHFSGYNAPGALWDDHSHILLLGKKHILTKYNERHFNSLCMMLALGLNNETKVLCNSFSQNKLNDTQISFLNDCFTFFSLELSKKEGVLKSYNDENLDLISDYLNGLLFLTKGQLNKSQIHLNKFLPKAASNISEATALFALVQSKNKNFLNREYNLGAQTRYFVEEIKEYFNYNYIISLMIFKVRNDIIRKKLNFGIINPSFLHSLKNIVMNLKSGKGFKLKRY